MLVLLTDGQLEEHHCSLPALQQAGVSAGGDGRHAETQGHQSQRQQVRHPICITSHNMQKVTCWFLHHLAYIQND